MDFVPATEAGPTLRLRPAPEQREMVLIGGAALFLNLVPGALLALLNVRLGPALTEALFVTTQVLCVAGPCALALRWFFLDPRSVFPLRRPRARQVAGALVGALGLNHLLMLYGAWQESYFPTPEILRAFFDSMFV